MSKVTVISYARKFQLSRETQVRYWSLTSLNITQMISDKKISGKYLSNWNIREFP